MTRLRYAAPAERWGGSIEAGGAELAVRTIADEDRISVGLRAHAARGRSTVATGESGYPVASAQPRLPRRRTELDHRMIRRNQPARAHASPSAATRGILEARRRVAEDDLDAYERQRWAIRNARTDDTSTWRAPRAPRRRRRSIRRTLGLALLLVIIALLAGGTLLGMRAAAFNERVSTSPFLSSSLFGPLNGSDRVNIVMVGYGGGDHDGAFLADSINVLSIDPATDTTTTIPIPRDLWVEGVTGFGADEGSKMNAAFDR